MSKKLLGNNIDDLKIMSEKFLLFGPKFLKWPQKMTKMKSLQIIMKLFRIYSMRFGNYLVYV